MITNRVSAGQLPDSSGEVSSVCRWREKIRRIGNPVCGSELISLSISLFCSCNRSMKCNSLVLDD